jgi:hypothetical protein
MEESWIIYIKIKLFLNIYNLKIKYYIKNF